MSEFVKALFDAHVHFRNGPSMREYVLMTARQASAAIAMPNTDPLLCTAENCQVYLNQIFKYAHEIRDDFKAMIFAYLLPDMKLIHAREILETGGVMGFKLYPKSGTTGSDHGISEDLIRAPSTKLFDICKLLEEVNGTLSIHGEMPSAFLLDREREFLASGFLDKIFRVAPNLRVTLEHISTANAVEAVNRYRMDRRNIAATITWQHIIHDVGHVVGRPHNFCRPCPSLPNDRLVLATTALSGNVGFMLGSDSAPHSQKAKHAECCSAGCYTAPTLIEELFGYFYETKYNPNFKLGYIERFDQFASENAAAWYNVTLPTRSIRMEEAETVLPIPPLDEDKARWYRYPRLGWKVAGGGYSGREIDDGLKSGEPFRT